MICEFIVSIIFPKIFAIVFSKELWIGIITILLAYKLGSRALNKQHKVEVARSLYAARYQVTVGFGVNETTEYIYQGPSPAGPSLGSNPGTVTISKILENITVNPGWVEDRKIVTTVNKDKWNEAINSVQLVFAKDDEVRKAIKQYRGHPTDVTAIKGLLLSVGVASGLVLRHDKDFDPMDLHFIL